MDYEKAKIIITKIDALIASNEHKVWFAEQLKQHDLPVNVNFRFTPKEGIKKINYYITFKFDYNYNTQSLSISYDEKYYNLIIRKFDILKQEHIKVYKPKLT